MDSFVDAIMIPQSILEKINLININPSTNSSFDKSIKLSHQIKTLLKSLNKPSDNFDFDKEINIEIKISKQKIIFDFNEEYTLVPLKGKLNKTTIINLLSNKYDSYSTIKQELSSSIKLFGHNIFMLIKYINNNNYVLKKYDKIVFGLCQIEVIDLVIASATVSASVSVSESASSKKKDLNIYSIKKKCNIVFPYDKSYDKYDIPTCRICYCELNDSKILLENICKCKTYVHHECINEWVKSNPKNKSTDTYYQSVNCEVCLSAYATHFLDKNVLYNHKQQDNHFKKDNYKLIPVINEPKIEPPYVILKENSKYHVISLSSNKSIKLGRLFNNGLDNISDVDIKLNDSSISKYHASLRYEDKKFILSDNYSRYGSYVLLNTPHSIQKSQKTVFSLGNSLITLSIS